MTTTPKAPKHPAFDPEKASRELEAAGWTKERGFVWKSPWGACFRGPAYAYAVMLAVKDNALFPKVVFP
jgi:ABC-type transport system substrate-binding protein